MLDSLENNFEQLGHLKFEDILLLKDFVNQNSRSLNSDGVNSIQHALKKRYEKLKFNVKLIPNSQTESGHLLVADFNGESDFLVTGIGHADTVLFPTSNHHFLLSSDSQIMTGPGIADNKSGLLIALKGFEYFLNKFPNPKLSLRFVSSPNEEIGSPGFHQLFNTLGLESNINLGFSSFLISLIASPSVLAFRY